MADTENGTGTPAPSADGTGTAAPAASSASAAPSSAAAALSAAASSAEAAAAAPVPGATTPPAAASAASGTPAPATPGTGDVAQPAASAAAPQGPVPFDRHQAAVANARTRALTEYGISSEHSPENIRMAMELFTRLGTDPAAFARDLQARIGGGNGNGQPQEDEPLPEATFRTAEGATFYDAPTMQKYVQAAIDRAIDRALRGVNQQIEPLVSDRTQAQERERVAGVLSQNRQAMNNFVAHARENYPHFKEREQEIHAAMVTMQQEQPDVFNSVGLLGALNMAYAQVLKTAVLPGYDVKAEERLRAENEKKAAAQRGAPPVGGAASQTPKAPTNQRELEQYMERLAAQSA